MQRQRLGYSKLGLLRMYSRDFIKITDTSRRSFNFYDTALATCVKGSALVSYNVYLQTRLRQTDVLCIRMNYDSLAKSEKIFTIWPTAFVIALRMAKPRSSRTFVRFKRGLTVGRFLERSIGGAAWPSWPHAHPNNRV